MSNGLYPYKKAMQIFGCATESSQPNRVDDSRLPEFARGADNRQLKSWSAEDLPAVGREVGFLSPLAKPVAIAVFVTKGGVLKSSFTLNMARVAALHGIRTCVVGLDMQGDVTTALSDDEPADTASLEEALTRLDDRRGLPDLFAGDLKLENLVKPTDLPTLSYIPETPELVALDQSLVNRNRREYWLRDNVIAPLKKDFDLILMDCSPNWNRLITNALVACDALVSPLECKINNFRNFKAFRRLLDEFREDMRADFRTIFVPTRLSPARKLSQEIHSWYLANLPECTKTAVRESVQGEEATAMRLSIPEYAPTSVAADEMRALIGEVWRALPVSTIARSHRETPAPEATM